MTEYVNVNTESTSPLERLACHWTTILDVEVTSNQVEKMLEAVALIAPAGHAVVLEPSVNVKFQPVAKAGRP